MDCETIDQFMAVLEVCRDNLDEDTFAFASPRLFPKIYESLLIRPLQEILICYSYEKGNPTVYGNVICCEMESSKAAKNANLTNKEMKITFNEYCRFHPPTYKGD